MRVLYLHSSEELVLTTQYLDDDNGSLSQPKLEVLPSSEKLRKSQACADRQLERHLWPGRSWFIKLKPIDDQAREDWLLDKRIYCRVLYILFCWLPWDRWPLHTLAGGGHGSSKYALVYTRIWSLWKSLYAILFTGFSGCRILGEWWFKSFQSFCPWTSLNFLPSLAACSIWLLALLGSGHPGNPQSPGAAIMICRVMQISAARSPLWARIYIYVVHKCSSNLFNSLIMRP